MPLAGVAAALAALSGLAVAWHFARGHVLWYGDAQAHLNIARRILDSRTPDLEQFGTVWLPLPHALMLPLVGDDAWWRNGLAGAIPAAACFLVAGVLLFAAARRLFASTAAGVAAALACGLNPNLLYLQSTAMTEPVFFAALAALLYATVRFSQRPSLWWTLAAALASIVASFTRYEGWFLIPFVAAYFLRRPWLALLFAALAGLAPLAWLAYNWWYWGDALAFYRGPYSAMAIYQRSLAGGMERYPGDHDWANSWLYFRSAAQLCLGLPLIWIGPAGAVAALVKRAWWPVVLLALPGLFYLWSVHSSGTPIFVPHLWPNTWYNTRYGLAVLPLAALGAAALVALTPRKLRALAAVIVIAAAAAPWLFYPRTENWICWRESQVNSETRRTWTREAADFLAIHYRPGAGIIYSFGDLSGILREAGIPLREGLHEGNRPAWDAAVARPEFFLHEEWAIAFSGDRIASALERARKSGLRYSLVRLIAPKGGPVVLIYRRD